MSSKACGFFDRELEDNRVDLNPVRMFVTTEAGALFGSNYRRFKDKMLMLDTTIVNPCASSNYKCSAPDRETHRQCCFGRKNNT